MKNSNRGLIDLDKKIQIHKKMTIIGMDLSLKKKLKYRNRNFHPAKKAIKKLSKILNLIQKHLKVMTQINLVTHPHPRNLKTWFQIIFVGEAGLKNLWLINATK